jgi:hypothetical protein
MSSNYKYHKNSSINNWKKSGVICDDFDKLYYHHMSINNCRLCKIEFNSDIRNQWRCLDHDHKTGLYRQTICHKCNFQFDRQKQKNNNSGYKNISFHKTSNAYRYQKKINGKKVCKRFKTLRDALVYKFIQILKAMTVKIIIVPI